MSDDLRNRVARAIANVREGGWPADTYALLQQHYLTMADAALAEMGGVRVKPLEWEDWSAHHRSNFTAMTDFGRYGIMQLHFPEMHFKIEPPQGKPFSAATLEAAKAAAQAYYEARILAAIEPAPVSTYTEEQVCELLRMSRQGPPGSLAFPVGDAVLRALTEPARAIAEGEE